MMGAQTASAQEYAGNPFTAFHSMQTFDRDGEEIRAVRLPVYLTLCSWENRKPGLRLRLAATFAASDLFDLLEQRTEKVQVLSFVPGIEFVLPVGNNHMLRPFLDAGIGDTTSGDYLTFLGAIGLRTEFIFPHGRNIFGLEPGLKISYNPSRKIQEDTVFNPIITLTARRVLDFRLAGYRPDAGVYLEAGYDFTAFELAKVSAVSEDINRNFEVGIGFGFSHGRPRIGPFRLPRLRVGYRFGDVEGFRIRLGGDWLTTLADQQ
jgi:hypothetical protein